MFQFSASKAREAFSDILNRAAFGKERVVLTRRGKRLAAVIPVEDLDMLEALEDTLDVKLAEKALASPKNRKRIPWERLKKELGL